MSAPHYEETYLNAPSGASTAAPYFVARRLLQLIAFCELQIIDWIWCLRCCLRLTFCIFMRLFACSWSFCHFASCKAISVTCKSHRKNACQKSMKMMSKCIKFYVKSSQIDINGPQERPKSTQMVPRSVPKGTLEGGRLQVAKKGGATS